MMKQSQHHERMTIRGHLQPASFVPWIMRHAAKLGLAHHVAHASADRIELDISGAGELIDMMEMGCSLGPIDVWVETIDRAPVEQKTHGFACGYRPFALNLINIAIAK
ncbi:acylphosphatase [Mesorhizobium sp. M1338]|uniref:acylphosphatase n=1 Tax=unclassified Mesorhizobium TaxID=325217 RepID=UPI0033388451